MELCVSLERETSTKSVCVAVFIQRKNFLINLLHIKCVREFIFFI